MAVIEINKCLASSSTSIRRKQPAAAQGCGGGRRPRTLWLLAVCACVINTLAAATPSSIGDAGARLSNCDLPYTDALRNYNLAKMTPAQGPVCGANSCCASVELKMKEKMRVNVERFFREVVTQVASLFETRSRRLEDLFTDMMNKSKKELHNMFERTYGIIYLQNANVFSDFFVELEKYYAHGNIRLAETMDHFFTILYQRMFVVINGQYEFNDDYLACIAKDIADLKPFGDIPIKLAGMLRRSFVATRTFHRSLGKGAQVVEKMMRLNITDVCGEEVLRMQHCDLCTGHRDGGGPCNNYCSDTIHKCLGDLSELNEKWNVYINGLDKVADKLLGPFNIEVVVEPINVKISEAIMNFQDSGVDVSQKVFQKCGQPKLDGDRTRRATRGESKEIKTPSLRFNKNKKKNKKPNEYDRQSAMEKRIVEVKNKIKDTRNFWDNLRYQYCNNITTVPPGETTCWNGRDLTGYPAPNTSNTKKQQLVIEQTYALGVIISHLESAFLGQDVDETDDEDEEEVLVQSGSGSGDRDDDDDTHVDEEDEVEITSAPTLHSGGSSSSTSSSSSHTTQATITTPETNDVEIDEEEEDIDSNVIQASSATELTKALAHYLLPIVMVWFGGSVTELL